MPGAVYVPVLLGLHRGDQQLPGPRGLRVRQHREQRQRRGEGRHLHVSNKYLDLEIKSNEKYQVSIHQRVRLSMGCYLHVGVQQ